MLSVYDLHAAKKATNVTINTDLLAKARSLNINCSAVLEEALAAKVKAELRTLWEKENSRAIKNYNRFVEESDTFSDNVRKF